MGTDYKAIGSSTDVQNVNPYTANAWNSFSQMMPAAQAGMGDVIAGLSGIDYDPTAWMNQLQSQNPALQGMVAEASRPYQEGAMNFAALSANKAREAVEQAYAGGNLYSGAFARAVSEGMAQPYAEAAMNSEQLRAGLLGNMYSMAGQLNAQGNQFDVQRQLDALRTQGDMYGSQLNMAGSGMAALGGPEWWQPTYVEDTPWWKGALGGAISGGLTGLMTGNPLGALVGAVGGGASGAFGMSGAPAGYASANLFGDEGAWGDVTWKSLFGGGGTLPSVGGGADMRSYYSQPSFTINPPSWDPSLAQKVWTGLGGANSWDAPMDRTYNSPYFYPGY